MDTEEKIHYRGNWQTMTRRGAITLRKKDYENGFFLALVANVNKDACSRTDGENQTKSVNKYVDVFVRESVSDEDFLINWLLPVILFPVLIGESFLFAFVFKCLEQNIPYCWCLRKASMDPFQGTSNADVTDSNSQSCSHNSGDNACSSEEQSLHVESEGVLNPDLPSISQSRSNLISQAEREPQPQENRITLDTTCKKHSTRLEKKFRLYFTVLLPVGIYYILPVSQLVYMYIFTLDATGNLDICYFNFECAYPLGPFKDFNHVLSNVGYLFAGSLAMLWLWLYHKLYHSTPPILTDVPQERHGILAAMWYSCAIAIAMVFEGVLSGCYHVCPNHTNFHHDTCFMYVAVTLTALKLYQSRHPDKSMTAPTAFVTLGCIMLIDLGGHVFEDVAYIVVVLFIHLFSLIFLYLKLLYLGNTIPWSRDMPREIWNGLTQKNEQLAGLDVYCCILVSFVVNMAIVGWHFYKFPMEAPSGSFDFGTYLLFILGGNTIVYYGYYLVMKCVYQEQFNVFSVLHMLLSAGLWIAAITFFLDARTSWQETPAESKTYNRPCTFYDSHDLWHMLSAGALYTNLLAIETLDHQLIHTKHKQINVF